MIFYVLSGHENHVIRVMAPYTLLITYGHQIQCKLALKYDCTKVHGRILVSKYIELAKYVAILIMQ